MSASKKFNKLVRRVHLWSGLFLVPWVVLYGVTAVLFNHSTWFTESTREDRDSVPSDSLPPAEELAQQVVGKWLASRAEKGEEAPEEKAAEKEAADELSARAGASQEPNGASEGPPARALRGGPRIDEAEQTPVASPEAVVPEVDPLPSFELRGAEYSGTLFASAEDEQRSYSIIMDLARARTSVRTRPVAGDDDEEVERASIEGGELRDALEKRAADELLALGVEAEPNLRRAPTLVFEGEVDGEARAFRYDLLRSQLEVREPGDAPDMTWRRFLLRLHTAHGVPDQKNVRWVWALIVDVMGGAMIFWGLSGILMWMQMPRLRGMGWWVLIASVAAAGLLGLTMYQDMRS